MVMGPWLFPWRLITGGAGWVGKAFPEGEAATFHLN